MISVSAIMMPALTNGLNQLPKDLYPHGTAIMTTLQPVAGAIGVSAIIAIMNAKQNSVLAKETNPTDPIVVSKTMVSGVVLVYFIAFVFAVIASIVPLFVYRAELKEMEELSQEE